MSSSRTAKFASSTQQEIEKLFEDKDSENTKRSTKVAKELFHEYLKEKNVQEPHNKKEFAQVLKSLCGSVVIMHLLLFSSKLCIIKQLDSASVISGIIKVLVSYQPQPLADNTYLDLDYFGYHKNLIQ